MATLGRGEKPVNLPEMYSVPFRFVLDLANELSPPGVGNRLRQMMIRRHSSHVQVFGVDRLVLADQPMAQFVKEIVSLIRDLFMNSCNLGTRLVSVAAPFDFVRKQALKAGEFVLRSAQELRCRYLHAFRGDSKRFQAEINADFSSCLFLFYFLLDLAKDGCKVLSGRCLGNINAFHLSFNRTMKYGFDRRKLRDTQQPLFNINLKMLGDSERLFTMFGLELREMRSLIEKIMVSNVQSAQRLLKRLRIHIFQPLSLWLPFHVRHHLGSISVRQPLLFGAFIGGIEINSCSQESIVDEPTRSKMPCKQGFLSFIRVKSKTICLIDDHALHFTRLFCKSQELFSRARLISAT